MSDGTCSTSRMVFVDQSNADENVTSLWKLAIEIMPAFIARYIELAFCVGKDGQF